MNRRVVHRVRPWTAKLAKAAEYQLLPCIKIHVISHISDIVSSALIAFSIPCMSVQSILSAACSRYIRPSSREEKLKSSQEIYCQHCYCREGLRAWKNCLAGLDSLIQSEVIRIPRGGERLYLTARTYFLWTSSRLKQSMLRSPVFSRHQRYPSYLAPGSVPQLCTLGTILHCCFSYTRSLIMKTNQSMQQRYLPFLEDNV